MDKTCLCLSSLIYIVPQHKLWIGVTDEESEGLWYWEHSRNAHNFTNKWWPGEPGGGTGENCAILDQSNLFWHDYPCDHLFGFVCEKY